METVKNLPAKSALEKFDFLRKMALDLGASDAKIITADKVVVEDRVVLKCKVGCNNYGKTLACPPYTPSAKEFRKIVGEYKYALFMKFTSKAEADAELQKSLSKSDVDTLPKDIKEKTEKFWAEWKEDKKEMLASVVKLEKEAMHKGYSLAISFVSGSCQLCEKCNTETRICVHPEMARYSEDAVGVNVKKTAENAGISFVFPFPKNPESFALLLID
jgi:predicted metal-binding protein